MTNSMTCEQFEVVLPELLDDESSATASTPIVRAHLESCAQCRSLLEDLTDIRAKAGSLPPLTPSRDLWSGIASRIEAPVVPLVEGIRVRPPRRQMSWRTAGLAAAALVTITTAVTYRLARPTAQPASTLAQNAVADSLPATRVAGPVSPAAEVTRPKDVAGPESLPVMMGPTPARSAIVLATNQPTQPRQRESAKVVYDREISRLRAIVDSGRNKLDPATVAILDRNLKIIDTAIEQCREALARDAASPFLIESLNNAYQTKVRLLRMAASAVSRG